MPEFTRQSLKSAIDAVRSARDALARTATECSEHGASRLALTLDELAANEDRFLALLLKEDAKLQYKAGALPDAPAGAPPAF
jgi:hypothetical protein